MQSPPVSIRSATTQRSMHAEEDAIPSTSRTQSTAPASLPAPLPLNTGPHRAPPGVHHVRSAWQVRQFAGSRHFGSVTIPRSMGAAELAEVQRALDRLGPFGTDRIDNFGRLHAAITGGNAASAHAVITLVRHRIIAPDQRGPDGDTLLHSLVEYGQQTPAAGMMESIEPAISLKERLALLIAAGTNPIAKDSNGRTAFERCLTSSRPDWEQVTNALREATPAALHLCKVDGGQTLLHRAARQGDVPTVERWLALGLPPDVGIKGWFGMNDVKLRTPLRCALKNQSLEGLEIARLLINAGANARRRSPSTGNMLLHRAVCDKDMQLLRGWSAAGLTSNALVSNYSNLSPLTLAVVRHAKEHELLELLCTIEPVNGVDRRGWAAIHYATASEQRLLALRPLIDAGADLNLHTRQGESPLELCVALCVKARDPTLFLALMQRGADPDIRNPRTGVTSRRLYNVSRHWWDGAQLD